ncbi:12611_t:CDS:1, partial [Acaulospora morrowiae]
MSYSEEKTTEIDLKNLSESLQDAAVNLKIACLSIRSCYVSNASSVKEFVDLRSIIAAHAKIYNEKILPSTNKVVQSIQNLAESYMALTLEEFKKSIRFLSTKADQGYGLANSIKDIHEDISKDFKKNKEAATAVIEKLEKDAQFYEDQAKRLRMRANSKYSWAIGLALIPGVNLAAKPFLIDSADNDLIRSIASNEESKLAASAACIIKEVFSTSTENFTENLKTIAGFFIALKQELSILAESSSETYKESHYTEFKDAAKTIIHRCRSYTAIIPSCTTDLRAISDNSDKNYVEEWVSAKITENDKSTFLLFK